MTLGKSPTRSGPPSPAMPRGQLFCPFLTNGQNKGPHHLVSFYPFLSSPPKFPPLHESSAKQTHFSPPSLRPHLESNTPGRGVRREWPQGIVHQCTQHEAVYPGAPARGQPIFTHGIGLGKASFPGVHGSNVVGPGSQAVCGAPDAALLTGWEEAAASSRSSCQAKHLKDVCDSDHRPQPPVGWSQGSGTCVQGLLVGC